MAGDAPWTIGRLLQWTTAYFRERPGDNPRLDAEVLLAHARGCERIDLYTAYEEVASDNVRDRFRELVKRRAAGEPVAYLVGEREFYSLAFLVTPDVLIPRPETELLVMNLVDRVQARRPENGPVRIADIGTGSGVIAVCAARHLPDAQVVAVDISPAALAVAQENARRHHVADRIRFLEGDLLDPLEGLEPFDFLVSNPPYVSKREYEALPQEIHHEPQAALLAGDEGTEVITRLLGDAAPMLRPGGQLMLEISPMIADAVCRHVTEDDRYGEPLCLKDPAGHARIVVTVRR